MMIKHSDQTVQECVSDNPPLEQLVLQNVRLLDLKSNLEIKNNVVPNNVTTNFSVTVGPSGDEDIHVNAILNVDVAPPEADESSSRVSVQIVFQTVFGVKNGDFESLKDHAAQIAHTGMLVMWPHFRELVMSITSRMQIPPIILPMYTVSLMSKQTEGDEMQQDE